jgi:predicted metal-dependent hydrolase
MTKQTVHIENIGDITFLQNRRSKTIRMSMKPNGSVLVSYPFYVSKNEVVAFVNKNKEWINKNKQKIDERENKISEGDKIQTKLFTVKFCSGDKTNLKQKLNAITITVPDFESRESLTFIENCFIEIYRYEAKRILPERIKNLAKQFHLTYNKVSFRNTHSTWGSCSSKNNISLNIQMMKLPDHLIDYIILHELVHTKIKNHGAEFWELLNNTSNKQAKKLAAEVKKYSTYGI